MSFLILMDSEIVPSGLGIPWPILAVANHFSIKTWIIDTQAGFHTCQLMLAYPLILYQCASITVKYASGIKVLETLSGTSIPQSSPVN